MFMIDARQMRNDRPVVFSTWGLKPHPSVDMHEPEPEKAIKDFIYENQHIQIERRQLENAKGFVELNTFYIESNKAHLGYKVSTWVLERIYCEKDGEIVKELPAAGLFGRQGTNCESAGGVQCFMGRAP